MDQPAKPTRMTPKPPPDAVAPAAAAPRAALNPKLTPILRQAISQMHVLDGAAGYKASLVSLRQEGDAPKFLADAYRAAPALAHVERWSIVTVMGDLHKPDALAPLQAIAMSPLPEAAGHDAPRLMAEETMIRTAAVEGIARQAAGSPEAKALLLQSAQSPVFSVRRAAAQAYLAQGGSRAELEKVVPADQRFMLDIKTVSASEIPAFEKPGPARRRPDPAHEVPPPGAPGAPALAPATDASRTK